MINIKNVESLIPSTVYDELLDTCPRFGLTTPLRLAHFLSQCHHESAGFTRVEENLNYSAHGLLSTFPKYFDEVSAEGYAHNPGMIGSHVYANRMGNGAEESQEGYTYRGRGFIQITGKDNYSGFGNAVPDDILDSPELVATKYPLFSAGWFWGLNKLNDLADGGADQQNVANVTKRINGGYKGLEERLRLFDRYYVALNA